MATEEDKKPDTQERYTAAVNASNLRVHTDADRGSSADMLVAAAWSDDQLGAGLLRLMAEWDGAEKPRRPSKERIEAMAATLDRSPALASLTGKALEVATKEDARRRGIAAQMTAIKWYTHELGILMGKLKTLPEVRRQVAIRAYKWKNPDPEDIGAAVLKYWLDQLCLVCNGQRFKAIPGTPSLSARHCPACQGSGQARPPRGEEGKRLARHLDDCKNIAERSMRQRLSSGWQKTGSRYIA